MSVANGQIANQTTFNNAFVSRTVDTSTIGRLDLNNAVAASGASTTNVQRILNSYASALGITTSQVHNFLITWATNNVGAANDTVKARIEAVVARFHGSTGHTHDGTNDDGPQLSAANLADLNYYRATTQTFAALAASGTSMDVTSLLLGRTPGGTSTQVGVVTVPPYNRISILKTSTLDRIEDAEGQIVYGRLTFSSGVWTLSFYTNEAGVETAYNLSSTNITCFFLEVFNLETLPTFSDSFAEFGSLDVTSDVVDATATIRGVVSTGTQTFGGAKTFNDSTDATSTTTGAVKTLGGIAAVKNIISGGQLAVIRSQSSVIDSTAIANASALGTVHGLLLRNPDDTVGAGTAVVFSIHTTGGIGNAAISATSPAAGSADLTFWTENSNVTVAAGNISAAGAWAIGATGGSQSHIINGSIFIRNTSTETTVQIDQSTGNSFYNRAGNPTGINFRRGNGTLTSQTAITNGQSTGEIRGYGWDGAAYQQATAISLLTDGTIGSGIMPGAIVFSTSPAGTATPVERMRISAAGLVTIGTAGGTQAHAINGAIFVTETINQLGAPPTAFTGYTAFSGGLSTNATGTADTQKTIYMSANAGNNGTGRTGTGILTGGMYQVRARDSNANGVHVWYANNLASANNASPTQVGFIDATGRWSIGLVNQSSVHEVNGTMLFNNTNPWIGINTADGADTSWFGISGGGNISGTRGAQIRVHGNESATDPGTFQVIGGATANNILNVLSSGGLQRFNVDLNGATTMGTSGGVQTHISNGSFQVTGTIGVGVAPSGSFSISGTQRAVFNSMTIGDTGSLGTGSRIENANGIELRAASSGGPHFSVTSAGLISIGASGGTQNHAINGTFTATGSGAGSQVYQFVSTTGAPQLDIYANTTADRGASARFRRNQTSHVADWWIGTGVQSNSETFDIYDNLNSKLAMTIPTGTAIPRFPQGEVTYAATVVGYGTPPVVNVVYRLVGKRVTVTVPTFTGTSNSTSLTLSLPAEIRPGNIGTSQEFVIRGSTDNGAVTRPALLTIANNATVLDFRINLGGNTWTNTGTKGIEGCTVTYCIA